MVRLRAALVIAACAVMFLVSPSVHAGSGYSGVTAAAYADKYWNNYNSAWPSFANKGGDCTNFVSQALDAGGIAMRTSPTYSGNAAWYMIQNHKTWSYSNPWVNAQDDSVFLEQNLVQVAGDTNAQVVQSVYGVAPGQQVSDGNAQPGDVVLYDWTNDGTFDHEAIITATDGTQNADGSADYDLVDAHTNNRYHAYWTLAQYNSYWATTRIVVLHIAAGTN